MKQATLQLIHNMIAKTPSLLPKLPEIENAAQMLCDCFAAGNSVYVCGNGGSASDSEHIVGEFVKAFRKPRPLPMEFRKKYLAMFPGEEAFLDKTQVGFPAHSLVSQCGIITAVLNDLGGENVYSQQAYAYVNEGDIFIGISTSGNSAAVFNAVKIAKAKGGKILTLTGCGGGKISTIADVALKSNECETYLIQQEHIAMYHALCAAVEEELV